MKKYLISGLLVATLIASIGVVFAAKPSFSNKKGKVGIPSDAIEVAPGVFYLGKAKDKGRIVEGYAFVKYKKGFGKPTGCNNDDKCQGWEDSSCADCQGGGNGEEPASSCYGFLAKGAKWKEIENYIVDAENTRGLKENFIASNLAADIEKWKVAAGKDILGKEVSGVVDGADLDNPDDKNEVYFADIDSVNAIGMTIIWGIFGGPPPFRELVEWDQIYDDVDFDWSEDCDNENCVDKMDFENIATHELGHSVGLDDLYNSKCSEQTMYGYAGYGETNKRILEAGDIAGIQTLYGAK